MSSPLAFVLVVSAVCALVAAAVARCFRPPTGRHANPAGAAVTVASLHAAARRRTREVVNPWPPSRGVLPGCHELPSWWPAFVRPYVGPCVGQRDGQREGPAPGAGAGPSASS